MDGRGGQAGAGDAGVKGAGRGVRAVRSVRGAPAGPRGTASAPTHVTAHPAATLAAGQPVPGAGQPAPHGAGAPPAAHAGGRPGTALAAEARRALVFTGAGLALAAGLLAGPGGLGVDLLLRALLLYGFGAWLVWRGLGAGAVRGGAAVHPRSGAQAQPCLGAATHPHARFGAANRVTLGRMAAVVALGACVGEPVLAAGGPPAAAWAVVVVATLAALLDAVDGALARRSGLASAFGARFDMETDAAFTLVLAALVYHAGQAGAWALAAGLMRYAFVAAAAAWPWLAAPLAPSRRRQAVCVATITALIVALAPVVPAPLAGALAAAATALLALSFAVDVRALARARRPHSPEYRP
jgi:phosphatidylglycerophosphate synthase